MQLSLFADTIKPYEGEHVKVRFIKRRGCFNRGVRYSLCRPDGIPLTDYVTADAANAAAKFVDEHGGSFDGEMRRAVKRHLHELGLD